MRTADLERTLVDIAVRPAYCQNIALVLEAYRRAATKADGAHILEMLDDQNYLYRYAQSIGFLMQRSDDRLRTLSAAHIQPAFYIAHGIKSAAYEEHRRVLYPSGL